MTYPKNRKFNVGDRVRWHSQALGHAKEKEGIIVAVVPKLCLVEATAASLTPASASLKRLGATCAGIRDHDSYIVRVRARTYYWPLVQKLTRIEKAPAGAKADAPAPTASAPLAPSPSKDQDPNGVDQHAPGAKLDAGKADASLLLDFGLALHAVAQIGTFGAKKYTRGGWKTVPDGETRYTAAMIRHLLQEHVEKVDKDSGLLHAAHAAWNALARLQLMLATSADGK